MTITAKEMNRIAIACRQEKEKAINEKVVNYFEQKVTTKIETAASRGRLRTMINVDFAEPVHNHMDKLLAYCHSLGFETEKAGSYRNGDSFYVYWENVPEEEECSYIIKTYEADVRYWGAGICGAHCCPRFEAPDADTFRAWVAKDFETNYPEFEYEILDVYEVTDDREEEVIYVEKYNDFFDPDEEDIII